MEFIKIENLKICEIQLTANEALIEIGNVLLDSKSINKQYIKNILDSYEEFGPYFVIAPGVAIAHAKPDESVIRDDIALMICKFPVIFNSHNDPVKILFGLCATKAHQHIEILAKIANLLSDSDSQKRIEDVKSKDELFVLLNSFIN